MNIEQLRSARYNDFGLALQLFSKWSHLILCYEEKLMIDYQLPYLLLLSELCYAGRKEPIISLLTIRASESNSLSLLGDHFHFLQDCRVSIANLPCLQDQGFDLPCWRWFHFPIECESHFHLQGLSLLPPETDISRTWRIRYYS